MRNLISFLASPDKDYGLSDSFDAFVAVMKTVLPIVLGVIMLLGMFFGIKLGITFAKAEDADARDKAKGQLINLCIGVGVAAVIIVVVMVLVNTGVFNQIFTNLNPGTGS